MPPSHRGPPISWASSVRVPSCTMGHLVVLDALLTPVPTSELTLPQLPPQRVIVPRWKPGEILVSYLSSHSCYRFTLMCVQERGSTGELTLLPAHLTHAHAKRSHVQTLMRLHEHVTKYSRLLQERCKSQMWREEQQRLCVQARYLQPEEHIVPIHSYGFMAFPPVC